MDLFRTGYQVGLTPDQVLDMSFEMFNACVDGYADRLFDQQLLGVQYGYWAGYYAMSKNAKPYGVIIKKMVQDKVRNENKKRKHHGATLPDVDVQTFLERERRFKQAKVVSASANR